MQSWGPGIQSFEAENVNFGYFGQHTISMKKHYGYFFIPPSGQDSGSRSCWKMQSRGPGIQSFEVINMNFGYFGQNTSCMKKHYWLFLLPPSGQASGSRCWKMQSWGPGIQSFEVVDMNFGYFGQNTSCMKKQYWLFLLPPSGQTSCSRRCWKRHSKGTGIQRFEAVNMNIGYSRQRTSSMKKHYGYFLIPPSEQGSVSGSCWKMQSCGPVVVIPPLPGKAGEPSL